MATTYKVLGQINPTANTATTLYTVPAATQTVVSTIAVCNQASTASTFSLAVQPAGAAVASKHYLNYQTSIPGNDTITITIGLTLGNTDVISANVGSSTISIHAYGSELT
jgi:glucose-6-phosphate dehydrogenase assembly protein OpcA